MPRKSRTEQTQGRRYSKQAEMNDIERRNNRENKCEKEKNDRS